MKRLILVLPALLATTACLPLVAGGATATGVAVAQERTVGSAIDDVAIRAKINHLYINSGTNNLYSNVAIKVTEGRVLLTGAVPTPDDSARAVQLAWDVDGVREVINELQVTDRGGAGVYARDAWITTQAKSRLLAEKDVRSINYNIETVNNVVYVMGLAQNQDELDRVHNVVSRIRGVERVVSHARLRDDPRRAAVNAAPVDNQPVAQPAYEQQPYTGYAEPAPYSEQPLEPLTPQNTPQGGGYGSY